MRKRILRLQPIGEILQKALRRNKINVPLEDRRLLELWDQAAGPQIAQQTRPESLRRGVLLVRVASSVWMHQLQFFKQEILEKIQQREGPDAVKGIRFILGEVGRTPAPGAGADPLPWQNLALREKDRKMIETSTTGIEDPELKDLLKRVMAKGLRHRRYREGRKDP